MPETRLWSSAKCSLKTQKEKLTSLRLFPLSNACCGAGSRVKQIAALSLLKREKKGYHMVLTAVSLSRWNASKTVATILNYCDKLSDSRWEVCFRFRVLLVILKQANVLSPSWKSNTGDERQNEERRNHTQTWVSPTNKEFKHRVCETEHDAALAHQRRKMHQTAESFSHNTLDFPDYPAWASTEVTAALNPHTIHPRWWRRWSQTVPVQSPLRTCSHPTWTLLKSFVESHFPLLIHTVVSHRTRKAEEISDCQDKRLLPSLHQGLALIYWAPPARSASANTILKMSLETEKVSQQFPALTRAFFPAHIISAELPMQLDEVNQQSGISKVLTIRSQVYCGLDYARYTHRVSAFWCEGVPKPQKITWIASVWLLSDPKVHGAWYIWAAALPRAISTTREWVVAFSFQHFAFNTKPDQRHSQTWDFVNSQTGLMVQAFLQAPVGMLLPRKHGPHRQRATASIPVPFEESPPLDILS